MKIIFLDIDGVLNTIHTSTLDTCLLDNLAELVHCTEAKIILISTWRNFFLWTKEETVDEDEWISIEEYKQLLLKAFSCRGLSIYDFAPTISVEKRNEEIKQWLNKHNDVTAYVIIDDMDLGYPKDRWVQTELFSINGGLQKEKMNDACVILDNLL